MSYSISYTRKKYAFERWYTYIDERNPYDDWISRGRPADTIFTFNMHYNDDILTYYFMPYEGLAYMSYYIEFVGTVDVVAQLYFDDSARTIEVGRLQCTRENYWSDQDRDEIKSGVGGIGWYKRNLDNMGHRISFQEFAEKFFSASWTISRLPLTRPEISPALIQLADACSMKMGDYRCGPWGKTVGTYLVHRNVAATTIQKHFHGWKVRMSTAFNPRTTLGAYYALREFRALLVTVR